jgi:ribosome biogenesis protein YTM1
MESSSSTARSIPVILKTSTPYPIPAEKYMIPVTWRRFHLSQLINKVLSLPNPIPFDFVVGGEMISGSLGEWCAEKEVDEVCFTSLTSRAIH